MDKTTMKLKGSPHTTDQRKTSWKVSPNRHLATMAGIHSCVLSTQYSACNMLESVNNHLSRTCYVSASENEGFILDTDQVSLSQESFYPSASPYHKENWTKVEISEQTHHLNLQEYAGETVVQREIEKKRQLSRSHPITNDYLVNVGSIPEENKDVIKYRLDSTVQNNVVYEFHSFITDQKVTDQKYRNLTRCESTLRAMATQDATREVTFDIGRYITLSPAPNNGIAVTLKLSNTNLYVTAKKENEPIQLQCPPYPIMPPKVLMTSTATRFP
ncbi:interleukin-1 alpha-like [Vombatus ursinus]|uniref:interleukin-1 alpha-like n=1 Tax=Vombatus ursinus TaxID=29139 RepID=UPI000FFD53F0|nr:interleukin-1 alpha-like [Vombatus ursinus]